MAFCIDTDTKTNKCKMELLSGTKYSMRSTNDLHIEVTKMQVGSSLQVQSTIDKLFICTLAICNLKHTHY